MPEKVFGRYPCRLVSITYETDDHFHGDNTGSNPVGDANHINNLDDIPFLATGPQRTIKDAIRCPKHFQN